MCRGRAGSLAASLRAVPSARERDRSAAPLRGRHGVRGQEKRRRTGRGKEGGRRAGRREVEREGGVIFFLS